MVSRQDAVPLLHGEETIAQWTGRAWCIGPDVGTPNMNDHAVETVVARILHPGELDEAAVERLAMDVVAALPFELKFWTPKRVAAAITPTLRAALASPEKAEGEIVTSTCPYCQQPVETRWTEHGCIPAADYTLIADWVYHSACWDKQVAEHPPEKAGPTMPAASDLRERVMKALRAGAGEVAEGRNALGPTAEFISRGYDTIQSVTLRLGPLLELFVTIRAEAESKQHQHGTCPYCTQMIEAAIAEAEIAPTWDDAVKMLRAVDPVLHPKTANIAKDFGDWLASVKPQTG